MDNKILIEQAIKLLQDVDAETTDTIEVQTTKYDDGSTMLTVNVAFLVPDSDESERK